VLKKYVVTTIDGLLNIVVIWRNNSYIRDKLRMVLNSHYGIVLCVLKDNNFFRRTKMKRRTILALVVFVLVAAPAIAIIWTQIEPQYQARAEVRVRPFVPRLVFKTDDNGMIQRYDSFVNTQVSIIRNQVILQRVLDRHEVQETQWYKKPRIPLVQRLRDKLPTIVDRLSDTLSVRPRSRTEIIDVSFTDPSVIDAKVIVDAVLGEYIKYIGEKTNAEEDDLYRQLNKQYISLQNQIQGQEATTANLSKSLGTETPQELISGKRLRLDEAQARLSDLRQRIAILEWEVRQANSNDSNMVVAAAGMIDKQPKYHVDAEWRKRDVEVRTIRHNIAASELESANPDIIRAQKDLSFAEELLKLRESQLDEQWRDRPKNVAGAPISIADGSDPNYVKAVIEHQLARARHEEQLLSEQYSRQQAEFEQLFRNAQLLVKENNALQHKRELFDAVRQRLDQKNMERNIPGPIEVLMRASASTKPYKDRRIMFTAIALVLGLGIGLCARFLFRRRAS
jgi:uncharacterized protein involved in exopolysaccharide biosynthesis